VVILLSCVCVYEKHELNVDFDGGKEHLVFFSHFYRDDLDFDFNRISKILSS
jgi:hypothetical protein